MDGQARSQGLGTRTVDPAEQRRATRELVDFDTRTTSHEGFSEVRVVNISPLGLMARTDADMSRGDRLIFELPHVRTVHAIVRWVEHGRIGTEFLRPIGDEDYRLMLAFMPRRQRDW
ncbi:MAG: pilus assembly protein PilZ [Sphingobium sp.]|jgi:hypothetical protein|nr:MAG: pilus assembly protein PilZ [Sphingobium sp.]